MHSVIKYLFTLIVLSFVGVLYAQERPKPYQTDLERANYAFITKKYNTAAQIYQNIYPKVKDQDDKQFVLFRIAESYRNSNNFKKALKWYEEVINARYPDPKVIYSYGKLLKNFERYDEARRAFYDYLFEVPNDEEAKKEMLSCDIALKWKQHPLKFNITHLKSINTEYSDYAPFFHQNQLYFTSSRKEATGKDIFEWTGQKYSDIFLSKGSSVNFSKAENNITINSPSNEGVIYIDSLGSTLFYTLCNGTDGKGVSCKILVSYLQNGVWTEGKLLPFNSDSFSCGHPSMSADGKRLFFASDKPGGFGQKDIWYVNYNSARDSWDEPVNCGPLVNTSNDEMFPFIKDNNHLYFASKGHIGMGGFDLFECYDSAATFSTPVNLKFPINSGGDDIAISFVPNSLQTNNEAIAFFSSNREGGLGDDDLYAISIKPFEFLVSGIVLDRETKQPINAANILYGLNQELNTKSTEKGQFTLTVPLNALSSLSISKEKYFNSGSIIIDSRNINKDTSVNLTIYLDLIPEKDIEITLNGIYYDLDKWDLRPESKTVLDSLVKILNANPNLVIELASHTDSRAPADYNLTLSKKRAQSCVDYLVFKGINKKRLEPVGYGETKLVNDCSDGVDCTEEEHQQNRRTTFRIIDTNFKK